jgi:transposase InsO family protein
VAHFIPVKTTYSGAKLTKLYMARIVCLHGVPKKIVLDRGTQFTSSFWQKLHESMDTKLNFSSAYHPHTDGHTERTNQILHDMLKLVPLSMVEDGTRVCPMQNSLTITTIKHVLKWPHLKPFIERSVGHLCIRIKQDKVKFSD